MIKPRLLLVRVHRCQVQYTQTQPVGKVYITLNLTAFTADTFFHCLFITAFHLYSPNLYIPLNFIFIPLYNSAMEIVS